MKRRFVYFPMVACLVLGWLGCNGNEQAGEVKNTCEGDFSICNGDHDIAGCKDGSVLEYACEEDEICVEERNYQAICKKLQARLCGNNVLDEGEQCDTIQLDYQSCGTIVPGTEGRLLCNDECEFDLVNCVPTGSRCGNGMIDSGEQCDRQNLNKKTCGDIVAGTQGTLLCDDLCHFDISGCEVSEQAKCGNGIVEIGEQCDGDALNKKTCGDIVHGTEGNLLCDSSCRFVTNGCHVVESSKCGNGVIDAGEQCDTKNLNEKTCGDVMNGADGILSCTNKCIFNTTYCYVSNSKSVCSNGVVEIGEQCDGVDLNGKTCADVLTGTKGALTCNPQCQFEIEGCEIVGVAECGNGIVEAGEQCDGANLNGASCGTLFVGTQGTLSCNNCRFDTSRCEIPQTKPVCGNDVLEAGEQCDTYQFNGQTCKDIVKGTYGNLICNANCQIMTDTCLKSGSVCGNGVLEDGERCDGTNLDNKTCADIVEGSVGQLLCDDQCQFALNNCKVTNPVVGMSCNHNQFVDVCYQDALYYCDSDTSSVEKDVCADTGMICRTVPGDGDACVFEDSHQICTYEKEVVFYDSSCQLASMGVIVYGECRKIDNQFYIVLTYSSSVCSKDDYGEYVVSCNAGTGSFSFNDCHGACSTINETDKLSYGKCDSAVVPVIGQPCLHNGDEICYENNVLQCEDNEYIFVRKCSGNEECDSYTIGSSKWAGCFSECDSAYEGSIISIDTYCTTRGDISTFGTYICKKLDSNHYREFYSGEVASLCLGNNSRFICQNELVINDPCEDCEEIDDEYSGIIHTSCNGDSISCPTNVGDRCDTGCIPVCLFKSNGAYAYLCDDIGRVAEWKCSGNVCDVSSSGELTCQKEPPSPCPGTLNEVCYDCLPSCSTEMNYAYICERNVIATRECAGGICSYDEDRELICSTPFECSTVVGETCNPLCTPVCSDDNHYSYVCEDNKIVKRKCANNVCYVNHNRLNCESVDDRCDSSVGASCDNCTPVCSEDGSHAYLCVNHKIEEWDCVDNACHVNEDGNLTCKKSEQKPICSTNVGETCSNCVPSCSEYGEHAYLCIDNKIEAWDCAYNSCTVNPDESLECSPAVPSQSCSMTEGDDCLPCVPRCGIDNSHAYLCRNNKIVKWACMNNVCSVDVEGTLHCQKHQLGLPCTMNEGDGCWGCKPVCTTDNSKAYYCLNGEIAERSCLANICSVSDDGDLFCMGW